ncbi:hypothetical protein JYG23_06580 [Sedimentibacter sp. zth1]|uniref:hypothetical protein n=1 Tax=Sedimentibacter sp. zth1 TaxID=2816908 RepID=UPI001A929471|nr:hypothetical protein [Sedimentibacter sp. zth1]QSX07047.1 hypothetical protein JYG23_06580 [Sedimentibacter sp. zth1]
MNKISLTKLHEEILKKLTNKEFINRINVTEEKMQSSLLNRTFITKLSFIISKNNITCVDIRELVSVIYSLMDLSFANIELDYIYQFILNKSFPNLVSTKLDPKYDNAVLIYLELLKTTFIYLEKLDESAEESFNSSILCDEICDASGEEYNQFVKVYKNNYIYELILLNHELTKNDVISNINGILNICKNLCNVLKSLNIEVNTGNLYATIIGQYLGELALINCDNIENENFYINYWFEKYKLYNIGNISINKDLPDLMKKHIPIESQILIYSKFRLSCKNDLAVIKSVSECDEVLSNISNKDLQNNIRIKIHDFEGFLSSCGINIDSLDFDGTIISEKYVALLTGNDIVKYVKNISLSNNAKIMIILNDSKKFNDILESMKICNSKETVKMYLNVFNEYAIYLDKDKRKELIILSYYLIKNTDGEIKEISANLLGKMIALFEFYNINKDLVEIKHRLSYTLFDKYIKLMLFDDKSDNDELVFCFRNFIKSFISNLKVIEINDKREYLQCMLNYLDKVNDNQSSSLMLLLVLQSIDLKLFSKYQLKLIFDYVYYYIDKCNDELRLVLLNFIYYALKQNVVLSDCYEKIIIHIDKITDKTNVSINYLKYNIKLLIDYSDSIQVEYNNFMSENRKNISEIFLKNLKSATYWLEKIINIDFLIDAIKDAHEVVLLHVAAHLCNLVKVSAKEIVRNKAGKVLLSIGTYLSIDQRNEISVELLKGLEINELDFSKYIPYYLGRFSLLLHPKELDELIEEINTLYNESNPNVSSLALQTLGFILQYYSEYKVNFDESVSDYNQRLLKVLGIITSGLINSSEHVRNYTISLIGSQIFDSDVLSYIDKKVIFDYIIKKVLNLLKLSDDNRFIFSSAVSFNYIYQFIINYSLKYGNLEIISNNKVAFFSNIFNPFSLEHKKIIKEITDLGYDVYLSMDEFSWKKNLQSFDIRKEIIRMSIADEFNVFIFPSDISINILNIDDLKLLSKILNSTEFKIVIDSDTLVENCQNKIKSNRNTFINYEYLIYRNENNDKNYIDEYNDIKKKIKGRYIELQTVYHVQNEIVNNINILRNNANSNYVSTNVLKYIQDKCLYKRENINKKPVSQRTFNVEIINDLSKNIVDEIGRYIFMYTDLYENIGEELSSKNISLLVIRENNTSNKLIGFSAFHHISLKDLFSEFRNVDIANYVRKNTSGKIIIIDGLYSNPSTSVNNLEQILLIETLSYCLKNDFTYALYYNTLLNYNSKKIYEELELHGFSKLEVGDFKKDIYAVDMKFPVCLTLDIENFIKEPLMLNEEIKETVKQSRKKLQKFLTKLYPNSLVLSFDVNMLNSALVEQICNSNNVETIENGKGIGDYICVPYGNILKGKYIPNTATKSLHVEKYYNYDMRNFNVLESPSYASIERQIDTIKSFNRPIILADDILHYGNEIKGIDKILKSKNINVEKIIVAILSSSGKDLMDMQDRKVEYAYFIPNLRLWLKESMLYPFIGGYTVKCFESLENNLIPSINHILPYVTPSFMDGASKDVIYNLSMLCLQNTKNIFEKIEYEYEKVFEKNLVLRNVSEIIKSPRFPIKGYNMSYDLNKKVSSYIDNDIQNLIRIEKVIKY